MIAWPDPIDYALLLDTHVLLWWLADNPTLSRKANPEL